MDKDPFYPEYRDSHHTTPDGSFPRLGASVFIPKRVRIGGVLGVGKSALLSAFQGYIRWCEGGDLPAVDRQLTEWGLPTLDHAAFRAYLEEHTPKEALSA